MKRRKGITLISLILTIIILLILAYRLKEFIAPEGVVDEAINSKENIKSDIKEEKNILNIIGNEVIDLPNESRSNGITVYSY